MTASKASENKTETLGEVTGETEISSIEQPVAVPTRGIPPAKIDPDALKVIRRLNRFGHTAYLVGGCVRDLLLKLTPKDFDLVTSARPGEIRKLFRNCRLIGRRFRLAHILFRGKIIETATFRAAAGEQAPDGDLLIRSDNVFGSEQEDALRRDFTINGLFYDPIKRILVDYVGGLEDLVARKVRFIGRPDVRTREDPVRILRALKFAGRLGFVIEPATLRSIVRYRSHLEKCAAPRLLEEIFRMLRSGGAAACFRLMWETGVLKIMMPEVARYLSRAPERGEEREPGGGLWAYLSAIDGSERELLSNAVLLAAVLVHPVADASGNGEESYGIKPVSGTQGEIAHQMLRGMVLRLKLPKRQAERVQQLVAAQRRLLKMKPTRSLPRAMMRRASFPEALDLFEIGVKACGKGRRTLLRLRRASIQEGSAASTPVRGSAPKKVSAPAKASRRGRRHRRRGRTGKKTGAS
jgi:poly(A) polymerase